MPPQLLIIFYQFFGSNQNRTRTKLTEPVLSVLVQSGSGSGNIPTVRFSVLHEGAENRTEPNFGNTSRTLTLPRSTPTSLITNYITLALLYLHRLSLTTNLMMPRTPRTPSPTRPYFQHIQISPEHARTVLGNSYPLSVPVALSARPLLRRRLRPSATARLCPESSSLPPLTWSTCTRSSIAAPS